MATTVNDLMATAIVRVSPDTSIAQAKQEMDTANIHHLLVYKGARLVGVVSHRDFSSVTDESKPIRTIASELIESVPSDVSLVDAATLMADNQVHCLPVRGDDGHVVGVITSTDIAKQGATSDQLGHDTYNWINN